MSKFIFWGAIFVLTLLWFSNEHSNNTAASKPLIFVGKQARTTRDTVACPTADALYRVADLVSQDDKDAAMAFANSNGCELRDREVVGMVEDHSALHSAACLRMRGSPTCFWIYDASLDRVDDKAEPAKTAVATAKPASPPPAPSPRPIGEAERQAAVAAVKTRWRSADGDTVDHISQEVRRVALFVPRDWEVTRDDDGTLRASLVWTRRANDNPEDIGYSVQWRILPSGPQTASIFSRPIDEGWHAFALSLIGDEIDEDEAGANRTFIHAIDNLDFVRTPEGSLASLLRAGKCSLGDPVVVGAAADSVLRVQLSVSCHVRGPSYFTKDGVVIFIKAVGGQWEPQSFFAKRLARFPPGHWFDEADADHGGDVYRKPHP